MVPSWAAWVGGNGTEEEGEEYEEGEGEEDAGVDGEDMEQGEEYQEGDAEHDEDASYEEEGMLLSGISSS